MSHHGRHCHPNSPPHAIVGACYFVAWQGAPFFPRDSPVLSLKERKCHSFPKVSKIGSPSSGKGVGSIVSPVQQNCSI